MQSINRLYGSNKQRQLYKKSTFLDSIFITVTFIYIEGSSTKIMLLVDVLKMTKESTITNMKIQEESSKELQPQLMMKKLQRK